MNAEIQDATKHPLYRAHHGDMTGWRYINTETESRERGDECIFAHGESDEWGAASFRGGGKYSENHNENFIYRRRVAPAEKPDSNQELAMLNRCPKCGCDVRDYEGHAACRNSTNQPRFVTVVYEVDGNDLPEGAAIEHGRKFHSIREGNALAVLDGLEDRCKLAIHNAFTGGVV